MCDHSQHNNEIEYWCSESYFCGDQDVLLTGNGLNWSISRNTTGSWNCQFHLSVSLSAMLNLAVP